MNGSLYQHFKNTLTIKQLCQDLNLPIKIKDGFQDCPFCGRLNKLRVRGPNYKCFHPECGKSGSPVDWLIDLNFASSVRDSISMLSSISGLVENKRWLERTEILTAAFEFYKKADCQKAKEVLQSRGISKALNEVSFGYAPDSNYLESCGLTKSDLKKAYLLSQGGGETREFFQDRIIFPIYNENGKLVHLQGRACNPNAKIRWLSTSFPEIVSPINHYLFNLPSLTYPKDGLFLCEGISDSLSMIELGLPVVGCFGVNIDLTRYIHLFSNTQNLIVMIDNDQYEISSEKPGDYKSWNSMVPTLIDIAVSLPELNIYCLMVPEDKGKDVNDWVKAGATQQDILKHVDLNSQSLEDFCLNLCKTTSLSFREVLRLVKSNPTPDSIQKLEDYVLDSGLGISEFLLENL